MESADTIYEDTLLLEYGFNLKATPSIDPLVIESETNEVNRLLNHNVVWGSSVTSDFPHYVLVDESLSDLYDRMRMRKQNKSYPYDQRAAREAAQRYGAIHTNEHLPVKVNSQQGPVIEEEKKSESVRGRTKQMQRVLNGFFAVSLSTIALSMGGAAFSTVRSVSESHEGNAATQLDNFNKASVDYANAKHDADRAHDFIIGAAGGLALVLAWSACDYAEERRRNGPS